MFSFKDGGVNLRFQIKGVFDLKGGTWKVTNFSRRVDQKGDYFFWGLQKAVLTMTHSILCCRTSNLKKNKTIPSYCSSLLLYCSSCKQLLFKGLDISPISWHRSNIPCWKLDSTYLHQGIFLSFEHKCTQFFRQGLVFSFKRSQASESLMRYCGANLSYAFLLPQ